MLLPNRWTLKQMPSVTYAAQFEFLSPLSVEQCDQKLSDAMKLAPQRGKTTVYEVSHEGEKVIFGAKLTLNQSAWYLAGSITPEAKQSRVRCYSGLPMITLIFPIIILAVVLVLVGVASHMPLIGVVLLFVAVLVIVGFVGLGYARVFRRNLERDIRQLLNA